MRKIYLHIGRHKSGTSSIQRFLYDNQSFLKKNGFCYPTSCIEKGIAHHSYAQKLERRNFRGELNGWRDKLESLKDSFSPLFNSFSETEINIVSSEAFQNCDPKLVAEIFSDFDVRILVYIRNEIDYLASAYAQKVQATRYSAEIEDYAKIFEVDYSEFLDLWARNFENKIEVRVFDRNYLLNGNVVDDFITHGLNIHDVGYSTLFHDQNPSLTNRFLNVKRHINEAYEFNDEVQKELYLYLSKKSGSDKESGKVQVPVDLKEYLLEKYQVRQKKWSEKYFSGETFFDYENFFSEKEFFLSNTELETEVDSILSLFGGRIVKK